MADEKQKKSIWRKKIEFDAVKIFFSQHHRLTEGAIIAVFSFFVLALIILPGRFGSAEKEIVMPSLVPENIILSAKKKLLSESAENKFDNIDSSGWQTYKNPWYGFELKYPAEWERPTFKRALRGTKWEYRLLFRKKDDNGGNPYNGFDVIIYDGKAETGLLETEEFTLKDTQPDTGEKNLCDSIEGHLTEGENYPAEEIYIGKDDTCFNQTYFFSLTRDQYIYNIAPAVTENHKSNDDFKKEIQKLFPEFFSIASSFELTDIVRPKPKPPVPKITARKPVAAKRVGGKLVCAKKNDKPQKSDKGKGKHLDLECCLDPDEYPNPWCSY